MMSVPGSHGTARVAATVIASRSPPAATNLLRSAGISRSIIPSSRAFCSNPYTYTPIVSHRLPRTCVSTSSSSLRCKSTMAGATDSSAVLAQALANNKAWAANTTSANPSFFETSAKGQKPKILWLGCADSRVPESLILGLEPGQIFTHRNIANVVSATDLSVQSIIEFAVGAIGVEQIVVCGHTACGGVAGAMGNSSIGAIDVWLTPLRAIRERLVREGKFEGKEAAERNLMVVEENVREGVRTVRANPNVLKAGKERTIKVHGFVYELHSGLLRELDTQEEEKDVKARADAHDTSL